MAFLEDDDRSGPVKALAGAKTAGIGTNMLLGGAMGASAGTIAGMSGQQDFPWRHAMTGGVLGAGAGAGVHALGASSRRVAAADAAHAYRVSVDRAAAAARARARQADRWEKFLRELGDNLNHDAGPRAGRAQSSAGPAGVRVAPAPRGPWSNAKTKAEAKNAFRAAARTSHPDVPGGSLGKMKTLNADWDAFQAHEAYTKLGFELAMARFGLL